MPWLIFFAVEAARGDLWRWFGVETFGQLDAGREQLVTVILIITGILALTSLVSWLAYLQFCRWLVKNSGTESLKLAAIVASAFRSSQFLTWIETLIRSRRS
jgi:hypothetical protein